MSLVYVYDGSFDGLLTAVFDAFATRRWPDAVAEEACLQISFGQQLTYIETNEGKARRVERGILRTVGSPVLNKIWTVFLADTPQTGTALYRYIRHCFAVGRGVYNDLAHPDVLEVDKLYSLVGREAHYLKEFLRFSEMEGGVFYARITPVHRVLPVLMPHFSERYSVQPFLIHDVVHEMVGVFDLREWELVETACLNLPDTTCEDLDFRRLWKGFYDAIAVRERYNPRCRRNMMPKKYWKNMTEHNFVETPQTMRIGASRTAGARLPSPEESR